MTLSGFTRSSDFPTTAGALLRVHPVPVDGSMGWVARFRTPASGASTLLWSTLYGASGNQTANDVVVDSSGAAVIVGGTAVNNPPTTERAFDRIPANGVGTGDRADGYIAKISSDGSQLLYSTLLGASRGEAATEVVPAGGNSYVVAGITDSTDFPTTAGAFDTTYAFDGRPSGNDSPGTLAEDIYLTRISLDTPATDTSPPPAPTISWPTEGSVFNLTSSDGVRVAYDWSDVTDPSGIRAYHVQVSPNAEFRNDLQAEFDDWYEPWSPTSFDSYFYCCSDSTNLTYSMRVQALDNAGNLGPWSPVRTYRLVSGSTSTALTAPTLTSPPNNGRYAPGSITLAWSHVAGATSYRLEADTTTAFNSSNKITVANLTTNTRAVNLTGNRTWRWRVRAFNGTTAGPLSTVRSVQTQSGSPAAPTPPAGTPIPPPASSGTGLKSLVISPELAFGNQSLTGTVTLHTAAPAGGAVVDLVSQYPTRVIVPPTVTVPAGQTTATFTGSAADGPTAVTATVMGTYGGSSHAWYVQANRGEQTLVLGSLALGSPTVQGGGQVTGTVTFSGIGFVPGPGGAVVHLGSTNPAVASVPPTVTIPQGANSATFTITTTGVASNTPVTIIATRSSMQTKILEVLPAGGLSGLSFNPTTAVGSGRFDRHGHTRWPGAGRRHRGGADEQRHAMGEGSGDGHRSRRGGERHVHRRDHLRSRPRPVRIGIGKRRWRRTIRDAERQPAASWGDAVGSHRQSGLGHRRIRIDRHGQPHRGGASGRCGRHADERQPGGRVRPGQRHRSCRIVERPIHRDNLIGRRDDSGHDHRIQSRRQPHHDPHGQCGRRTGHVVGGGDESRFPDRGRFVDRHGHADRRGSRRWPGGLLDQFQHCGRDRARVGDRRCGCNLGNVQRLDHNRHRNDAGHDHRGRGGGHANGRAHPQPGGRRRIAVARAVAVEPVK